MKIGELARQTATPIATIRFYESAGLLADAVRTEANYRLYSTMDAQRVSFIRNCRQLDMSLDEIATLLRFKDATDTDCTAVNALLEEHLRHVSARIRTLRELERELADLRAACQVADTTQRCQILARLSTSASASAPATGPAPASAQGHIHGAHGAVPTASSRKKPQKRRKSA